MLSLLLKIPYIKPIAIIAIGAFLTAYGVIAYNKGKNNCEVAQIVSEATVTKQATEGVRNIKRAVITSTTAEKEAELEKWYRD